MMNKKWMILSMLVLVIAGCMMFSTCAAKADANLMENGSVNYVYIGNEDDLRQYIDADGIYSSQENLAMNETGNIYKIIIDEPGELIICPLTDYFVNGYIKSEFQMYSDFKLTSKVTSGYHVCSDRSEKTHIRVNPGTYYYQSIGGAYSSRRSDKKSTLTVYVGFIPDDISDDKITDMHGGNNSSLPDGMPVEYINIKDKTELYDYINHNGKYSLQTCLKIHQVSEKYPIVINQPGELIICPLVKRSPSLGTYNTSISVYSNKELTSKIIDSVEAQNGNRFGYYTVQVDPGVYYLQGIGGGAPTLGDNPLTIYLGFISTDNQSVESIVYSEEDTTTPFVNVTVTTDKDMFAEIVNDKKYTSTHMLKYDETTEKCAFHISEPGQLIVTAISPESGNTMRYAQLALYSDSNLTSQIIRMPACNDTDVHFTTLLIDAGTYYYQLLGNTFNKTRTDVYVGFIPTSSVISIDHIEPSETSEKVHFSISDSYDPDKYYALVRVVSGRVLPFDADNQDIWQLNSMENAIESHEFIATENGIYTARIAGVDLQTHLLTFEVTGITSETEESAQTTDDSQPSPEESPEASPEEQRLDEQEPVKESAAMTASEMRKYIRMLEDQIEDLGLEIPEFSENIALNEYMTSLEQVLRDNGYDF